MTAGDILMCHAAANTPATQANIKLESYGYAIADATAAIKLDPNYVKVCVAMYRLESFLTPRSGILSKSSSKHGHSEFARRFKRLQNGSQEGAEQQGCKA